MKSLKSMTAALLLLGCAGASGNVLAWHGGGGYHGGYHGGHHGRVGVVIGGPIFGFPYYGYPYYGAPVYGYPGYGLYGPATTIVTVPQTPPVYVERGTAAIEGPASDGNWYYCHNPDGYYPYVKQCAENWQVVPAQPPAR